MSKAIVFGSSGTHAPVDDGTNWIADLSTNDFDWAALTLASVANAAARQSIKVDLGLVRPREWILYGCVDYSSMTPTAGNTVDYWWAPATSGTQANGNTAGNSGGDAACPDGAVPTSITLDEFLDMGCQFIGSLTITDGASVENGLVGKFIPESRWGQLIVENNGGAAFASDDIEAHQLLMPVA